MKPVSELFISSLGKEYDLIVLFENLFFECVHSFIQKGM
jgi:hypothetical protein